jgi:hypothetical protein
MNKFISTALTITALAAGSNAAPTGDSEWLELDREINGLSSKMTTQGSTRIDALFRGAYVYSTDDIWQVMGEDISGFELLDIDLGFAGEVGNFAWRFSFDLDSGSSVLEDAYLSWGCGDYFDAMAGNFKPHVARSASLCPGGLLFIDRSAIGTSLDFWDAGLGISGAYDAFSWFFSLMNGGNGSVSDHLWIFRGEYVLGQGAGDYEGAFEGGDEFNATVGASFWNSDVIQGDATGYLVDFWGQQGPLGFGAEVMNLDDDLSAGFATDYLSHPMGAASFIESDSTPWNLTGSYLLNDEFEVAARYQSLDNTDDATLITLGVNWYRSGHQAKWQFNVTQYDDDNDDGIAFAAGWSLGASG